MSVASNLFDFQQELLQRAKADSYLGVLPILDEHKGDITRDVNEALGMVTAGTGAGAGKLGACVIILSPTAESTSSEIPGCLLKYKIGFRVLETVLLNNDASLGFQKPALAIARQLLSVFQHYTPAGLTSIMLADKLPIQPVTDEVADNAYEVTFTAVEATSDVYQKCSDPLISPNSGAAPQTVTLTTATAGASIYYTLDGTYPSAVNPTALLYSAPVSVTTAKTLRAVASKTNFIDSNCPRGVFT